VVDKNVNAHPQNSQFENTSGIRRRVLTLDRIKAQAIARLGFSGVKRRGVDVEIEEDQMGILWELTLDEYNKWLPLIKRDVISATSGTRNQYDLRTLNKPYGRGLVDVRIAAKEDFFSPISGVFALGIPHPISHLSPDQYDLAVRYINLAKKIYSSEPDWEWEEPILWLYAPSGFGGPFVAAYQYHQDAAAPEDIPQEDWKWAQDYFFNLVKYAVGESRGKFGTIPGPAGQSIRGEAMASEATEALDRLREDIETKSYARVAPLGPNSVG